MTETPPDLVEIQLRVTTGGTSDNWHNAEGPPTTVAAWMRAYADLIDPPTATPVSGYPARGLHTNIRSTHEHRDRAYGGRPGFGPIHASQDQS